MNPSVSAFAIEIENLVSNVVRSNSKSISRTIVNGVLDGQVYRHIRQIIPLADRRNRGVFFTSQELAKSLVDELGWPPMRGGLALDPSCGAGDLLLECARRLPVATTLEETLGHWGRLLAGVDIDFDFIRITKARLVLLAAIRSGVSQTRMVDFRKVFPQIVNGDFLARPRFLQEATHIIINPPFCEDVNIGAFHGSGARVSVASMFFAKCIFKMRPQTRVSAILPDVLRSGANYSRWRGAISEFLDEPKITLRGCFDKQTDIDVFTISANRTIQAQNPFNQWFPPPSEGKTVGHFFRIWVGTVVPHRDPKAGPWVPYLTTKTTPPWSVVLSSPERRRFLGRTFIPPFLAIRRTSRPGKNRAVATLVFGKDPVALENHLLVAVPKNGSSEHCNCLLKMLQSDKADAWLNRRIRCRHLTVSSLQELPWSIFDTLSEE